MRSLPAPFHFAHGALARSSERIAGAMASHLPSPPRILATFGLQRRVPTEVSFKRFTVIADMMGDAIGPIAIQAEFRDGKSSSPVRNTVKRSSERSGTNFTFWGSSKITAPRQRSTSKPGSDGAGLGVAVNAIAKRDGTFAFPMAGRALDDSSGDTIRQPGTQIGRISGRDRLDMQM